MEIVINTDFGGFGVSDEVLLQYEKETNFIPSNNKQHVYVHDLKRNDPILIKLIKEFGKTANGDYSQLSIVEIPDDVNWIIQEYDGKEWIAEVHRTWR